MEIIQDMRPAEEVVWDYYGTPLKAMRRIQLWRLADIHKIPFPRGCSKENLLKLLDHHEVQGKDVMKPPPGMTNETFWSLINGPRKEYHELGGAIEGGQTNVDILQDALDGKSYFEMEETEVPDKTAETFAVDWSKHEEKLQEPLKMSLWLKSLSWGELKKEAKARGLSVPNTMKRPELEAILNG